MLLVEWIVVGVVSAFAVLKGSYTSTTSVGLKLNHEQVKFVNAFVENLGHPTATVTVGMVATPVVHVSITPSANPTATPAAAASYRHYDAEPTTLFSPPSFQDTLFAVANFLESGTIAVPAINIALPGFDITGFQILMAVFILGLMNLVFMIFYKGFQLPAMAAKCLSHAFFSGSKVLWTLIIVSSMYLGYDTLSEDPLQLAAMELIFLEDMNPDFVARFVRAKVMIWRDPIPQRPTALWLMSELFGDIDQLQQTHQFKPKSLEEVFVGVLVWLYRLACAHFDRMTTPASILCSWIRPRIKPAGLALFNKLPSLKQMSALVLTLQEWLQELMRLRWKYIIKPILLLFVTFAFYILPSVMRDGPDEKMAGDWEYYCAFGDAPRFTYDDIAKLILAKDHLEKAMAKSLPEAREKAALETVGELMELGKRCIVMRENIPVSPYNKRRAYTTWRGQMEDYAAAGRMDEWHVNQAALTHNYVRFVAGPGYNPF